MFAFHHLLTFTATTASLLSTIESLRPQFCCLLSTLGASVAGVVSAKQQTRNPIWEFPGATRANAYPLFSVFCRRCRVPPGFAAWSEILYAHCFTAEGQESQSSTKETTLWRRKIDTTTNSAVVHGSFEIRTQSASGLTNMCIRTSRTSTSGGATLVLSLLLSLSLQLRGGSSFVLPLTAAKRCHHASRSASCVKTIGQASATDSPAGSDEGAEVARVEEQDDDGGGQARSPAGLTLEGVYKRLKLETQGLADGVVGLESKDTDYGVS